MSKNKITIAECEKKNKITIAEFESKVFEIEDIKLIMRGKISELVDDYPYERRASNNMSLNAYIETRIKPLIGDFTSEIIDGTLRKAHGKSKLQTIRESYDHN
ncbi:MAG: hypothetical protein OXC62_06270 [Aestuariivita sp.]|nr:hypothetical protein [Aestuariivita sp.]